MYRAKTGRQPPKEMQAAMAAVETVRLEQLAIGVARHAGLPRNLSNRQREAVMAMARNLKNHSV